MKAICSDCAKKRGMKPKDKVVGMWTDECATCGERKFVTAERDYYIPGQRRVTFEDILLDEELEV